ncbi:MAG: uroporphyrinogen-III synthase [Ezakiella sp.]|nr:uroporphyrinogen-III synthase [Ezakiella sp.]MDD7472272.1 uroporphyrinogen-III synthase [Bacillota bacterium]MDY3923010.1 uroporphyrinogen-III synthase [Ezakiella sp.]
MTNRKIIITTTTGRKLWYEKDLIEMGMEPILVPTIEIVPINRDKLTEIIKDNDYNTLIFHSQYAVKIFIEEYKKFFLPSELNKINIYSVGKKTCEMLMNYGVNSIYPKFEFTGDALFNLIKSDGKDNLKIFFPHSKLTDEKYIINYKTLSELKNLVVYDNQIPRKIKKIKDFTDIIFTASSTFNNFIKIYGKDILKDKKIFSIGRITSKAINNAGLKVYKEPKESTIDSLLAEIRGDLL